jgi:hypothetical protein
MGFAEVMGISPAGLKGLIGTALVLTVIIWGGMVVLGKMSLLRQKKIKPGEMTTSLVVFIGVLLFILALTVVT